MKITFFSPESVDAVRDSLETALKTVAEHHGIAVKINQMVYRAESCEVSVECAVLREDGEALTREAMQFRDRAAFYGLDPALIFKSFIGHDGKRLKLIGLNPKAKANPFVIQATDGTIYAASEATIRDGFKLPARSDEYPRPRIG